MAYLGAEGLLELTSGTRSKVLASRHAPTDGLGHSLALPFVDPVLALRASRLITSTRPAILLFDVVPRVAVGAHVMNIALHRVKRCDLCHDSSPRLRLMLPHVELGWKRRLPQDMSSSICCQVAPMKQPTGG